MSKLKYLDHLDSLRALAVLLVLLFHLDIHLFKGGFIGVDVFFVISGFLITRNILHEYKTTNSFSFTRFYYRRVKRLLPSFFLTAVFVFILGFLLLSPSDFISLTNSIFSGSIALSNFYFLGEAGYFDTTAKLKPMLHTWSLSIEEQYYFIWPLTLYILFRFFHRFKVSWLILGLTIIAIAATWYVNAFGVSDSILAFFSSKPDSTTDLQSLLFFLLPFRSYEFLLGALLVFIPEIRLKQEWLKILFSFAGFALVIIPGVLFDDQLTYLSVLNLIPCIGISLLIISPKTKIFNWFYANALLRLIGNASYTIYLFHWPIIVYYKHLFDKPLDFLSGLLLFIISIGISLLVYRFYETPIRHSKAKRIQMDYVRMGLLFLVFSAGSYALKWHIAANDGWTWRLGEKNLALIEAIGVPLQYHYTNWGGAYYSFETAISNKERPKDQIDMIWMGDSHSGHYAAGLDSVLVKKHGKKVHISYLSCFVLPDVIPTGGRCTADADSILNAKMRLLEANPEAVFVVSYYWRMRLFSFCEILDETTGKLIEPSKLEKAEAYQLLCEKIEKLRTLVGKERKIIVMGASPVRTGNLNYVDKLLKPSYLSFIAPVSSTFEIEQSVLNMNQFMRNYFESKPDFYFIDPSEPFCAEGTCISQKGNEIYFSDANHFSKVGSVQIAKYFENTFLDLMPSEKKE